MQNPHVIRGRERAPLPPLGGARLMTNVTQLFNNIPFLLLLFFNAVLPMQLFAG